MFIWMSSVSIKCNVNEGDGWLFRDFRGLKQLTGRDNYTKFGESVDMTAEQQQNMSHHLKVQLNLHVGSGTPIT